MSHPRQQFVDQGRSKLRTGLFLARRVVDSLPRARPSQPSPPSQPSTPRDTLLSDPTDAAFVLFEVSALQTACPSWSPCAVKGSAPGNWITGSPTLVPSDPVGSTDFSPLLLLSQQRLSGLSGTSGSRMQISLSFLSPVSQNSSYPYLKSPHREGKDFAFLPPSLSLRLSSLCVALCGVTENLLLFLRMCVCVLAISQFCHWHYREITFFAGAPYELV